jgi:gluconolactonase
MAMAELEILDNRFKPYIPGNCWLEKLYTGTKWAEGPVYFPAGDFLLWSDIPNNRMLRFVDGLGTSVFRSPSNFSNGNTLDQCGRLITCEHLGKVTRTEADGTVTVLAEKYEGKRLNSPNDVVVKSDGSIWFTDPPYGILSHYEGSKRESEIGANYVFRLDPATGGLKAMSDDFVMPNGIAFSPDETRLYVSDTGGSHDDKGPHHIRVFTVTENGSLSGGEVFAEISPGLSDGFRLDTDGNVWTSAGDGVHCISPEGDLLGKILVPEPVANIEFGGPERNRLFICATTSLYSIYTSQNGARKP